MSSWRNVHLLIGTVGLILFVLQGQYMLRVLGVPDLPDAARMSYRSAHLYLMLASSANIAMGVFMSAPSRVNYLQRLASVLLLVSPALLIWSFLNESNIPTLERPVAAAGLYLIFGASVSLLLDEGYRRISGSSRS